MCGAIPDTMAANAASTSVSEGSPGTGSRADLRIRRLVGRWFVGRSADRFVVSSRGHGHGNPAVTFSMNSTDEVKISSASLSIVATW